MHEVCEQLAERSTFKKVEISKKKKRWKSQAQMVRLELRSPLLRDDGKHVCLSLVEIEHCSTHRVQ